MPRMSSLLRISRLSYRQSKARRYGSREYADMDIRLLPARSSERLHTRSQFGRSHSGTVSSLLRVKAPSSLSTVIPCTVTLRTGRLVRKVSCYTYAMEFLTLDKRLEDKLAKA